MRDDLAVGFPHSDIHGSTGARPSPQLFAACHVLHRLLAPRHPPNALISRLIALSSLQFLTHAQRRHQTRRRTLPPGRSECIRPVQIHMSLVRTAGALRALIRTSCSGRLVVTRTQPDPLRSSGTCPHASARVTSPHKSSFTMSMMSVFSWPLRAKPEDRRRRTTIVLRLLASYRSSSLTLVELNGIEPMTSSLQSSRSPN